MTPTPDVGTGFQNAFQIIGNILFEWVPAVGQTLVQTGTPQGVVFPQPPMGPNPATAPEMVNYLQNISTPYAYDVISRDWGIYVALSLFVTLLLIILIIYCVVRILQIRHAERLKFASAQETVAAHDVPKTQLRWHRVKEDAESDDPQKMRLAILEADIMLNELLDTRGYKGETMADKMRTVDRADFRSIDLAWEAHRARNAIAHQGSAAPLDDREARRIIGLYEKIFREFGFVE